MNEEEITTREQLRKRIRQIVKSEEHNRGNSQALYEFQHAERMRYELYRNQIEKEKQDALTRLDQAQKRTQKLEAFIVEQHLPTVIDNAIKYSHDTQIPFVYYGFDTERLMYSSCTLEFLGIEQKPEEQLSLHNLLSYIINSPISRKGLGRLFSLGIRNRNGKSQRTTRSTIFDSLRQRIQLDDLPIETVGGTQAALSTHPYTLKNQRVLGLGISFKPKMDQTRVGAFIHGEKYGYNSNGEYDKRLNMIHHSINDYLASQLEDLM